MNIPSWIVPLVLKVDLGVAVGIGILALAAWFIWGKRR